MIHGKRSFTLVQGSKPRASGDDPLGGTLVCNPP